MKSIAARELPAGVAGRNDLEDPVPSPCNAVCRMNVSTGLCEGCLRTLAEIAGWGALDDAGRRAVWHRIEQRAKEGGSA